MDAPNRRRVDASRGISDWAATRKQRWKQSGFNSAAIAGPSRHPAQLCSGVVSQASNRGQQSRRPGRALANQDDRSSLPQLVADVAKGKPANNASL